MARHDSMIARAVEVASTSEHRWMLGCVVVRGGRVLGTSTNKYRNPPHINHLHATRHAEMAALARCLYKVSRSTVYVARVDKMGQPRLAKPCEECLRGLTQWGVRFIVYTDGNGGYQVEKVAI